MVRVDVCWDLGGLYISCCSCVCVGRKNPWWELCVFYIFQVQNFEKPVLSGVGLVMWAFTHRLTQNADRLKIL